MRRKEIDAGFVVASYLEGVPVRKIAAEQGCSEGPIYRALGELRVAVSKKAPIDPDQLHQLYVIDRLSMSQTARRLGVSRFTVRSHLRLAGIPLRTRIESLQPIGRRACPPSVTFRSYALGFVWGDMAAERLGAASQTVAVRGSTTKAEQLAVIDELFGSFGKVTVSRGRNSTCVRASLDLSFAFLLEKYEPRIPVWVSGLPAEAAFAAGYIDAEGSFGVYDNRGRFKLDSYDGVVHRWMSDWMDRCGIIHITRRIASRGDTYSDQRLNGDLWRTNVNEGFSLRRLVTTIEPFARHARRRETMAIVAENVRHRLRSRDATLEP